MELVTERTIIAPASEVYASALTAYFTRNRDHFARWEPRRPPEFYEEAWWRERTIADTRASFEDRGYRCVVVPRDDRSRVIGMLHFANVVRGAFHSCHLGFSIDGAHQGKGIMREALERAIAWAFDDLRLHRIEANHRPENTRSAALLERLGFVPIGYARDYLLIDGEWRDHVLTARVNDRWSPRPEGH
jgi:ribosomal-protein-alanine N-acetyltransferase